MKDLGGSRCLPGRKLSQNKEFQAKDGVHTSRESFPIAGHCFRPPFLKVSRASAIGGAVKY